MRLHIFFITILVGIVPLTILSYVLFNTYEDKAIENKVIELRGHGNMINNVANSIGFLNPTDDLDNVSDFNRMGTEVKRFAEIYNGRIIIVNNSLNIIKDTYGLHEGRYLISEDVISCFNGTNVNKYDRETNYIKITYPITHSVSKEIMGVIVMNIPTKEILNIRDNLERRALVFILTLAVLIVVFATYFSGKLTKPLNTVINSIDHLKEGYLDEKVSIKGYYEVERISESFNQMLGRMQKLENSRQEFVSNVSHELKTPITSIKVLADSLLAQEDVPVELYREFLHDITEEIERENKIINDLLSLVKLDKTSGDMNISSVSINELLELILKRLKPIAEQKNVEIVFESFRPVFAEIDEVKLSLAISNLVENAIKYNYEEGWVRVSLNADHKYFYIKVSDSGIGIPEESQELLFDRFYRVDKARAREAGGTGLGLSITQNVIHMHRGAIKLYSKEDEGTIFNVRVPLNYVQ